MPEYYSAVKRNKTLIHDAKWMKPEKMLSKKKKTVTKYHILYDPIPMKYPEQANLWRLKMDLWLSESESGVGEDMIGFFFFPQREKNVLKL